MCIDTRVGLQNNKHASVPCASNGDNSDPIMDVDVNYHINQLYQPQLQGQGQVPAFLPSSQQQQRQGNSDFYTINNNNNINNINNTSNNFSYAINRSGSSESGYGNGFGNGLFPNQYSSNSSSFYLPNTTVESQANLNTAAGATGDGMQYYQQPNSEGWLRGQKNNTYDSNSNPSMFMTNNGNFSGCVEKVKIVFLFIKSIICVSLCLCG